MTGSHRESLDEGGAVILHRHLLSLTIILYTKQSGARGSDSPALVYMSLGWDCRSNW